MSPDLGLQGVLQPSPSTQPAAATISSSCRWAPTASARRAWWVAWWAPGCTWWAPWCKWWAPCASVKAPSVSALPPLPPPLPPLPPLPPPLLLPPLPLLLRSVAPCGPPRGSSGVLQSAVGYRSSVAASTQQSPAPPPSQQSPGAGVGVRQSPLPPPPSQHGLGVPVGVTQLLPPPLPPPPSQQGVVGLRVGVELAGTPLQVPVPVPVLATAPLPTPVPALLPLPVPVPAQVPVAVGKPVVGVLLLQPVPGAAGRPMQALPIRPAATEGDSQSLSSSSSSSKYWYDDCCVITGASIASPSSA